MCPPTTRSSAQQQQLPGDLGRNLKALAGSHRSHSGAPALSSGSLYRCIRDMRKRLQEHVCGVSILPEWVPAPLIVNTVSSDCSQVKVLLQVRAFQSQHMHTTSELCPTHCSETTFCVTSSPCKTLTQEHSHTPPQSPPVTLSSLPGSSQNYRLSLQACP